jgi:hypothetical protein
LSRENCLLGLNNKSVMGGQVVQADACCSEAPLCGLGRRLVNTEWTREVATPHFLPWSRLDWLSNPPKPALEGEALPSALRNPTRSRAGLRAGLAPAPGRQAFVRASAAVNAHLIQETGSEKSFEIQNVGDPVRERCGITTGNLPRWLTSASGRSHLHAHDFVVSCGRGDTQLVSNKRSYLS